MASSVKPRPTHYETLELKPTATDEEIREAFKRKISLFRAQPVSGAAQVCIAYETLRDPIKRQEYHDWLGLVPEPEPSQLTFRVAQPRWSPFIAAPDIPFPGQPATDMPPRSKAPAATERETAAPVHPKVAALAASLRELAKPAAPDGAGKPQPKIEQQELPGHRPQVSVDELVEQIRHVGRAEKERLRYAENRPFDWKRPAIALGSLVLGAAVIGALAGLSVKGEEAPAQAETAEKAPLPAATRHLEIADPSPTVAAAPVESRRTPRVAAALSSSKRDVASQKRRAALLEQQVLASLPAASSSEETDKDTQSTLDPPQAVAANLPLSSKVIARTIERIGYACGEVASTTAVDEQRAGVFRVACTSGDSYQATPVGGRYHFRRVGRH